MPTIFLLDDEPTIVLTWALILTKRGYKVEAFSDPQLALERIRQHPPDLLVSDVGLPEMTGIDLAITLLTERIGTKVLLVSGQAGTAEQLEDAVMKGHEFEVLPKPVGPALLLSKIQELLKPDSD